jgi:DNA-binding CsgD family transcriptional regulator
MKVVIDTVQKRIGLLISVVGLAMVVSNFLKRLLSGDIFYALSGLTVWAVFIFTVPFILSVFIESGLLKKLQILAFALTGAVNIIDAFQEFYGPGLFLAAWLLMRHYGYLEKHAKIKNIAILGLITALSQLSAMLHSEDAAVAEGMYVGFGTLMYTLFLVTLLVILWRDMVKQQDLLRQENFTLKMDYHKLTAQLMALEHDKKPYDLKAAKITPAESRVIEALTIYKAGNREIAERLNLAESTVKLHLYNICNKIGVDNRFAIIDLCKYNFNGKE